MEQNLQPYIEALIFSAEEPISLKEIRNSLEGNFGVKMNKKEVLGILEQIKSKFQGDSFGFEMVEIADGYQFLTKAAYHDIIGEYLKQKTQKRLSKAALETLSIIAYRQPVTKVVLEQIRGVNCDYSIQKLLEKEMVTIVGRAETPGRPLLYGTSQKFMNYFGIKSLKDLPKLKDFKIADNEIGVQADIEEEV